MHVVLLTPVPVDVHSGAAEYHRGLVAGLRAAGHAAEIVELAGVHPLADGAACDVAAQAWAALAPDSVPVIDAAALPAFRILADALPARRTVALVHHLTGLAPGQEPERHEALRDIERRLLPLCSRLVATSAPVADRLATETGDPARIATLTPGVDELPRSVGSGRGCTVLSVGMLVPRKGHDVLIRALARLFDLDWRLTIAGSAGRHPAHAAALRGLVRDAALESRVRFVEAASAAELDALWRKADLFALATRWEGYAGAVAQALRRGLPLAVTAGGTADALVPAGGGVVCPVGDEDGLSKAMRRVIFDHDLRAAMAETAWRAGQALPSWCDRAERFVQLLGDS